MIVYLNVFLSNESFIVAHLTMQRDSSAPLQSNVVIETGARPIDIAPIWTMLCIFHRSISIKPYKWSEMDERWHETYWNHTQF